MSEAGTHGTAAVCLLKCWERTSENHILHAGNEPLLDIWAAAQKATLQRQVASRGPPSSMEYLNRLFPSNSPPQNNPSRACTHSHTHPSQNKEGSQTSPVCTGQSGQGHKRQVCAMGVWRQTDRHTPMHCRRSPGGDERRTRGDRQDAGTSGPRGRGSSRGSPWRAQAEGAPPVLPKRAGYSCCMSAPGPAAARGGGRAREWEGGRGARARLQVSFGRQVSGGLGSRARLSPPRARQPARPAHTLPARAPPPPRPPARARLAARPREPREAGARPHGSGRTSGRGRTARS